MSPGLPFLYGGVEYDLNKRLLFFEKDINNIMITLGVFVAAIFRMIPSFNRIIFAVQNMKYKSSSVDLLFNEFKSFEQSEKTIKKYKEIKFENKIILKEENRVNILKEYRRSIISSAVTGKVRVTEDMI